MPARQPIALDTSPDAERLQFELWSRMSPTEKFEAFARLMAMTEALAEAGIRQRHPEADDREVFLRRAALTLGAETVRRLYGWDPASGR